MNIGNNSEQEDSGTITYHEYNDGPIKFYGLGEEAFDGDLNTSVSPKSTFVTWDGDLTDRVVSVTAAKGNQSLNELKIHVVDKNNNKLTLTDINGNSTTGKTYRLNKETYSFIVPHNAEKIQIINTTQYLGRIFEIEVSEDKRPVVNEDVIKHTKTSSSISFNWETYATAFIYKNNKLLSKVEGYTFTDKPLYSNSTNEYEIILLSNNHVGTRFKYVAKTASTNENFRGIGPAAFDGDKMTYVNPEGINYVTWDGDLTGKTISITGNQANFWLNELRVYFVDKSGNNLLFKKHDGSEVSNVKFGSNKQTHKLIVPEGADKLKISNSSTYHGPIYDISVIED